MPKISVIVPTYNRTRFLPISIKSILAQTFEDYEIIIVDDGSTDDTSTVVRSFSDSRIKYIRQSNAGQAAARNTGLSHAAGEYIGFLDDDDLYVPSALQVLSTCLDKHPDIGMVSGGWFAIDEHGVRIRERRPWETYTGTRSNGPAVPLAHYAL